MDNRQTTRQSLPESLPQHFSELFKADVATSSAPSASGVEIAIRINQHNAQFLTQLALVSIAKNNLPKALSLLDKALIIDPECLPAMTNKLSILSKQEDDIETWRLAQRLLQLSPHNIDTHRIRFSVEQRISARYVFGCADMKILPNGEIKILEFGSGSQSAFTGLTSLTKKSIHHQIRQAEKNIDPSFNCPPMIWITSEFNNQYDCPDRAELLKSFQTSYQCCPSDFAHYQAVVAGNRVPALDASLLRLNSVAFDLLCDNKYLTHQQFLDLGLDSFRPKTFIIDEDYRPSLIRRIVTKIPGDRYVIKAPDLERGAGVWIATKPELKLILPILMEKDPNKLTALISKNIYKLIQLSGKITHQDDRNAIINTLTQKIKNWHSTLSEVVMIEEFCEPRLITHQGQSYDPTYRVPFIYLKTPSQQQLIFLPSYAKLPPNPYGSGRFNNDTISSYSHNRIDAQRPDTRTISLLEEALSTILPPVIDKMLSYPVLEQFSITSINKPKSAMKLLKTSNTLALFGEYTLAYWFLAESGKLHQHENYFHQKAHIEMLSGDLDLARRSYAHSIATQEYPFASRQRIALMDLAAGKRQQAIAQLQQLPPDRPEHFVLKSCIELSEHYQKPQVIKTTIDRFVTLACHLASIERYALAAHFFKHVIHITSGVVDLSRSETIHALIRSLLQVGDLDKAITIHQCAQRYLANQMGNITHADLGALNQAIRIYTASQGHYRQLLALTRQPTPDVIADYRKIISLLRNIEQQVTQWSIAPLPIISTLSAIVKLHTGDIYSALLQAHSSRIAYQEAKTILSDIFPCEHSSTRQSLDHQMRSTLAGTLFHQNHSETEATNTEDMRPSINQSAHR